MYYRRHKSLRSTAPKVTTHLAKKKCKTFSPFVPPSVAPTLKSCKAEYGAFVCPLVGLKKWHRANPLTYVATLSKPAKISRAIFSRASPCPRYLIPKGFQSGERSSQLSAMEPGQTWEAAPQPKWGIKRAKRLDFPRCFLLNHRGESRPGQKHLKNGQSKHRGPPTNGGPSGGLWPSNKMG